MPSARLRCLSIVIVCGLIQSPVTRTVADDSPALSIVDSARARSGLCIHVGCGDGSRTAALAKSGQYVVHGLSSSPDQVQRARQHIQSLQRYGAATVDCCSLAELPYSDDLDNLVVVDDLPGVLEAGASVREMIRILAPLGVAVIGTRSNGDRCMTAAELKDVLLKRGIRAFDVVEKDGVWARITKPRPKEMDEWPHASGPLKNLAV